VKDRLRQVYRTGGFGVVTATLLPLFLAAQARAAPGERDAVRDRWVRRWAKALLDLFAVEVVVRGTVPVRAAPGERGRLLVANHRSAIDIGVVLATFGGTMVSRADLASWPLVGAAARAVGTVFVDRTNAKSGAVTIRAIQRNLEEGQTIALFPEGTTFSGDEVRPFHGGAFIAAARAGADVLPVGLAYPAASGAAFVDEAFLAHLGRMAKSSATRMALVVGEPIATRGLRAAAIAERAHAAVSELVGQARTIAGP
jgi:1-acyl-sn-glycerol-3-phosphate acyltransferase